MASKINKKSTISIQGIFDVAEDGILSVDVEDVENPVLLSELFAEYKGKDVKIVIALSEDIE